MSAEENEIYLHGTISVLLCIDGLESQTSNPATSLLSGQFVDHPPTHYSLDIDGNKESTLLNY